MMCSCGIEWYSEAHTRRMKAEGYTNRMRWRGHTGQLEPHRQWCRENLPSSAEKFILAADDGFARQWTGSDPIGAVMLMEWKTYGADLDYPTQAVLQALNSKERYKGAMLVRLIDGNTPGVIRHYPEPCACGLPERPVVASNVMVYQWESTRTGSMERSGPRSVTPDQLAAMILAQSEPSQRPLVLVEPDDEEQLMRELALEDQWAWFGEVGS